jgi:uncharacterized protein YkwD
MVVRRQLIIGVLVVAAGLGTMAGPTGAPGLVPGAIARFHGRFVAGPPSTAANRGYLPPALAGEALSVPVESYQPLIRPRRIGVQFVGLSARGLRRADVALSVTPPDGHARWVAPAVSPTGLVWWAWPTRSGSGSWRFVVGSDTLGFTTPWTVTVTPGIAPASPVAETGSAERALALLNGIRRNLGLDAVGWGSPLARASRWHAQYLARYGTSRPSFHVEAPGPGYYGRLPWDRDLRAGWPDASTGEVGVTAPTVLAGPVTVATLLDTVYHRLSLLSGNLLALGVGSASGPVTAATIMDLGFAYRTRLHLAVAYPAPNQRGVPTAWLDTETPNPVPGGVGRVFGYPVTLDCPTAQNLGPTTMALILGRHPVPAYTDAPGSGDLAGNQVALVPKRPLRPHRLYTVVVLAPSVHFYNGSVAPLYERWSFRTGGGDQAVYVAYQGGTLLMAVDDAASDMVAAGVPLTVHIAGRLLLTRSTITAPDGVATLRLRLPPGPYRAVVTTASGGRGTTQWRVRG